MRIVKLGTKRPTIFRGTCNGCGCEFEAHRAGLVVEADKDGELSRVTCPQCGARASMYPAAIRAPD